MHAAFPVNDQDDLTGLGIGIDDDFVNECSNEAFLQSDIRVRISPDGLKVRSQILKFVSGWDQGADCRRACVARCAPRFRGHAAMRYSSVAPTRRRLSDSRDRSHRIVSALGE